MLLQINTSNIVGTFSNLVGAIALENGEVIYAHIIVGSKDLKLVRNALKEPKSHNILNNSVKLGTLDFSKSNIAKTMEHRGFPTLDAKEFLYVSTYLSDNSDILNQYFLISKESENPEMEIKKSFFSENMRKLPIPMKKEWEDFFWENLKDRVSELKIYGNVPYKGYKLDIPTVNELEEILINTVASYEFKKFKGRVPAIKALLKIADIKDFDLKGWATFFRENFNSKEDFEALPFGQQEAIVRGFEVLGNNDSIITKKASFANISWKSAQILFRNEKNKGKKVQYRKFLNDMEKEFSLTEFPKAIENFQHLISNQFENMRLKQWIPVKKALKEISYKEVNPLIHEISDKLSEIYDRDILSMSKACSIVGFSEETYKRHEELYLGMINEGMTSATLVPTITVKGEGYTGEMMSGVNPESWTAGEATNCCQKLGGFGSKCVEFMGRNPQTSGVFLIKDKKGNTVAQSLYWINSHVGSPYQTLCFDSIEYLGSLRSIVKEAYMHLVDELAKHAWMFKIEAVTAGFRGNLFSSTSAGNEKTIPTPPSIGYTDAKSQVLFAEYDISNPFEVTTQTYWN